MMRFLWSARVFVAAMLMAACGGGNTETPATQPSPHPTAANNGGCPVPGEYSDGLPREYRRVGNSIEGDLRGGGRASRAVILGDDERPLRCRYFLEVEGSERARSYVPIEAASSLPHDVPALLMAVEIDGEPGLEVVVDFGGPTHPHRSGQVFTFDGGSLVAMRTERPQFKGGAPILFPLHGEFPAGVDCAAELGAIVITWGDLAKGGADDSHYEVTRTFYRAQGHVFVEFRQEMHTLGVGTERERWPELADDPFRSCSAAR